MDDTKLKTIKLQGKEYVQVVTRLDYFRKHYKDGVIKTPPPSHHLLNGVTREFLLELARKNNLPVKEIDISETELKQADEIWVTSSSREIFPIVKLDGLSINQGAVGPMWGKMMSLYQTNKR